MMRLILSNRWFALIWVTLVLLSVMRFAGPGGEGIKATDQAIARIQAKKQMAAQIQQAGAESPMPRPELKERLPGEGYDPTPRDPSPQD